MSLTLNQSVILLKHHSNGHQAYPHCHGHEGEDPDGSRLCSVHLAVHHHGGDADD